MTEREIYSQALELQDAEQRASFLERACGGDAALHDRLQRLLNEHDNLGSYLEVPAVAAVATTIEQPLRITPGLRIGRYRLLEQIGEGGMGTIWVAEQTDPVKRRVALKLIKPGMDSRQVLARFDAERQALALMDHPNIAKVHDGGVTDEGRPYFVMEYVKGVPITEYCDGARLSIQERLRLFIPVCQAVQHAHQKGIIHRDLKPSNILVCLYDGQPVPKVIDFGLAKAINQPLTEHTLYTAHGLMVGTPLYMSPEQAEFNNLDIDTRSDIYSLGVILYELLTGTTPLEKQQFQSAAFQEVLRLIKEVEPLKPSARLSSSDRLPSIAAQRSLEPAQLSRVVRGDLDWIVMKSLDKDRARRYETPNGLCREIDRFLNDEPVEAGPPSASYRLRKFMKKHRARALPILLVIGLLVGGTVGAPMLTIFLVIFLLVSGIVGTSIGMLRAMHAESDAKEQKDKAQAAATASRKAMEAAQCRESETQAVLNFVETRILVAARPEGQAGGQGREIALRQAIDAALPFVDQTFANQPLIEARLRMTLGKSFLYLGEAQLAAEQYLAAHALYVKHLGPEHLDTLQCRHDLANSYFFLDQHAEALRILEETFALRKGRLGHKHEDTIASMHALANIYSIVGRHDEELQLREEVLALSKAKLGPEAPDTIVRMMSLGNAYIRHGRYAEALKLHEVSLALAKHNLGPRHPSTLACRDSLARSHSFLGQHANAVKLHEENLVLNKAQLGLEHPNTLNNMNNLTWSYFGLGRTAEGLQLAEETLTLRRAKSGAIHPDTLGSMLNVALGYAHLGRHAEALQLREEAFALRKIKLGPDHPKTLSSMSQVSDSYADLGRHADALKIREEVLALRKAKLGPNHPDTLLSMHSLASTYTQLGRHNEALQLHRETVQSWVSLHRSDAGSLYNAARMRAATANAIRAAGSVEVAPQDADAEADRAMECLRKAVAAGYPLRGRADFQNLRAALEARLPDIAK